MSSHDVPASHEERARRALQKIYQRAIELARQQVAPPSGAEVTLPPPAANAQVLEDNLTYAGNQLWSACASASLLPNGEIDTTVF